MNTAASGWSIRLPPGPPRSFAAKSGKPHDACRLGMESMPKHYFRDRSKSRIPSSRRMSILPPPKHRLWIWFLWLALFFSTWIGFDSGPPV
jgi:hypothetical protein